ncbi:MAG: CAP domain-containing protein [Solirubrobacteraceae bacterium]
MARSALVSSLAALCLLGGLATSAPAKSTRSRHAARCATTAHAAAASGTGSFRKSHCPKSGAPHRSKPAHLLFFTASGGRCPDSALSPSATDLALVRAATLCLVNRERAAHDEAALHWNADLVAAAQAHTESMAFGGYFAHIGRSGETPLQRMRRSGYIYSPRLGYEVGENIGWGSLWLGTPAAIVAAWMASPGHRANILDAHFRDTGIGVSPHLGNLAGGQPGGMYTQDFGVIVA